MSYQVSASFTILLDKTVYYYLWVSQYLFYYKQVIVNNLIKKFNKQLFDIKCCKNVKIKQNVKNSTLKKNKWEFLKL